MSIRKEQVMQLILKNPVEIGHWLGFKDLTELHNEWLKNFLFETKDQTLQAHRGSYKTTVISLFVDIHLLIEPYETVIYFRNTDTDVKSIMKQAGNMLQTPVFHELAKALYGHDYTFNVLSNSEIDTSLNSKVNGQSQIMGLGIGTSITGKHADIVITDDIVNLEDRASRAKRESTKQSYMELQNIKNRGGRLINTGTPWHVDDAFTLMPNIKRYDCYTTGLIANDKLEELKASMTPSLFSANYELKHIADENALFTNPQIGAEEANVYNGLGHLDSAFYGEDYTAFSIMAYHDGKFYVFGKLWRKHVEDCYDEIRQYCGAYMVGKVYNETNADKGMVARDLKKKGVRTVTYHEGMNKHIKISTYLKAIWKDVVFVDGTDSDYINQICDYTEDAEHDDAPYSCACLARLLYKKAGKQGYNSVLSDIEESV